MFHPRGLGILCNCAPIIIKRLTVKIIKIDKNRHKEVIVCDNCQLNTNTKLIKKKKKVLLEFVNRVHVFSKALLTFFTVALSIQGSRSHSNILTG